MSGLSPLSPAANFGNSFGNFLRAQQENPEMMYRTQLAVLRNMGFTDQPKAIAALQRCNGNMNRAIDYLIEQAGPEGDQNKTTAPDDTSQT